MPTTRGSRPASGTAAATVREAEVVSGSGLASTSLAGVVGADRCVCPARLSLSRRDSATTLTISAGPNPAETASAARVRGGGRSTTTSLGSRFAARAAPSRGRGRGPSGTRGLSRAGCGVPEITRSELGAAVAAGDDAGVQISVVPACRSSPSNPVANCRAASKAVR
ncbi:MAG TPA: hypothetical protein DEQ43_01485 [Nocardioides bacterium]|uniref:hypothetical protein n=1 Tax=uncultured Nocardioides sp. TaxID=198441 RepID=UPI000EC58EA3|nr:hypothetical protein [uncultured Nocardioides sp.]HCB02933.1 hypothetical protein [Nocardioides sp.]